jgi:flagellar biosynthesis regulator FlaF
LKDLWGQTWFLDFGERLGRTYTDFKTRWFDTEAYTMETVPKKYAQTQIEKAISDITLSIEIKDYVDIQDPITVPVWVTMEKETAKQYRKLEREMYVELKKDVELTALSAAAKSTKCLQFAAGAAYYEGRAWTEIHDEKLKALESIVNETAGANLLVSYWWKHDAERIKKKFPKARALSSKQDFDDWNAGKVSMGLAHPQSAGHGLNLQFGGHHIVFFSDWWNLEARLQIIERIGPTRQMQSGFDRPVYVYQIMAHGTLDELVKERHEGKTEVQALLMRAMKRRYEG